MDIEIKLIDVVQNYRQSNNKEEQDELISSVKAHGILVPITVAKQNERYILIAGWRRLMAAIAANHVTIPANIRDNTGNLQVLQLIENIQRKNPDLLDEALAVSNIVSSHGVDITAAMLNKPAGWVNSRVLVHNLIPEAKEAYLQGNIKRFDLLRLATKTEHEQRNDLNTGVTSSVRELLSSPFDHNKKYGDLPACNGCLYNSATSRLFDDAPVCMKVECFKRKSYEDIVIKVKETVANGKKYVSSYRPDLEAIGLSSDQYYLLHNSEYIEPTSEETNLFYIRQGAVVYVVVKRHNDSKSETKAKKETLTPDKPSPEIIANVITSSIEQEKQSLERYIALRYADKVQWLIKTISETIESRALYEWASICQEIAKHDVMDKMISSYLKHMPEPLLVSIMEIIDSDKLQVYLNEQEQALQTKKEKHAAKIMQLEKKLTEAKQKDKGNTSSSPYPKLSNKQVSHILKLHKQNPDAIICYETNGYYLSIADDATWLGKVIKAPVVDGICGFTSDGIENVTKKIIKAGKKVALVSELEQPQKRNSSVDRKSKVK